MRTFLITVVSIGLLACTSDEAPDFAGYWQLESMTMLGAPPDTPAEVVVTRTSMPTATRSAYAFFDASANAGHLLGKNIFLHNGLMAQSERIDFDVAIEGDRWVIDPNGAEEVVFIWQLDRETLMLTFDASDARNAGDVSTPRELSLRRVAAPMGYCMGNWQMSDLTLPNDTELQAGQCTEIEAGVHVKMAISFDVDDQLLLEQNITLVRYADANCTIENMPSDVTELVGALEEDGSTLHYWSNTTQAEDPVYVGWTAEVAAGSFELTRRSCLPMPDCTQRIPSRVKFVAIE